MSRRAFTLIEVMAVVFILGILASATVWVMSEDAHRATREGVVGQVAHFDRVARETARRLTASCLLRFDLDGGRMWRVSVGESGEELSHVCILPEGCRIDRIAIQRGPDGREDVKAGRAEVPLSSSGRSATYAVRLVFDPAAPADDREDAFADGEGWLLFSGLTGQATKVGGDDEIDDLFSTLATGRADAR